MSWSFHSFLFIISFIIPNHNLFVINSSSGQSVVKQWLSSGQAENTNYGEHAGMFFLIVQERQSLTKINTHNSLSSDRGMVEWSWSGQASSSGQEVIVQWLMALFSGQ